MAHHLVAENADGAAEARDILSNYGIGISEHVNGVFHPRDPHYRMHTDDYYDAVNEMLRDATSRSDVVDALKAIKQRIRAGNFP